MRGEGCACWPAWTGASAHLPPPAPRPRPRSVASGPCLSGCPDWLCPVSLPLSLPLPVPLSHLASLPSLLSSPPLSPFPSFSSLTAGSVYPSTTSLAGRRWKALAPNQCDPNLPSRPPEMEFMSKPLRTPSRQRGGGHGSRAGGWRHRVTAHGALSAHPGGVGPKPGWRSF